MPWLTEQIWYKTEEQRRSPPLQPASGNQGLAEVMINLSQQVLQARDSLLQEQPRAVQAIMMFVAVLLDGQATHSFFESMVLVVPATMGTADRGDFHAHRYRLRT